MLDKIYEDDLVFYRFEDLQKVYSYARGLSDLRWDCDIRIFTLLNMDIDFSKYYTEDLHPLGHCFYASIFYNDNLIQTITSQKSIHHFNNRLRKYIDSILKAYADIVEVEQFKRTVKYKIISDQVEPYETEEELGERIIRR